MVLGGARSGKSALAQRLAVASGGPVTALVTAEPIDEEMASRIDNHRRDRPAGWHTVEAPYDLPEALSRVDDAEIALVDCATVWLSNLLVRGDDDSSVDAATERLVDVVMERRNAPTVVVSNEVGYGLVPPDPLSRRFRDAQGRANQRLTGAVDRALFVVAGMLVPLQVPADSVPELR